MVKRIKICLLLSISLMSAYVGGQSSTGQNKPVVEFTTIPAAAVGDPDKFSTIKGHVIGARPGQKIVLYARTERAWWVQPYANQPFTKIDSDSTWQNVTHPGTEYAALLVGPEFQAPPTPDVLPTQGVIAVAVVHGELAVWQRWWFPLVCMPPLAILVFIFYLLRMHQMTKKLNLRFEERLAERMRVAQELHDTLLQGVISASMQLHVAVDQLPPESPVQPALSRILQLMSQVVEEGRNTVRGLRSVESVNDLEQAFLRIRQEFGEAAQMDFRVVLEGNPVRLRALIRDEVYSIGREALVNAFRHSRATVIEVTLEYAPHQMKLLVSDNGCGMDSQILKTGREGHWGMAGMRERSDRIGARLKVWSRIDGGTQVEVCIPARVAFESQGGSRASKWLGWIYPRTAEPKRTPPIRQDHQ